MKLLDYDEFYCAFFGIPSFMGLEFDGFGELFLVIVDGANTYTYQDFANGDPKVEEILEGEWYSIALSCNSAQCDFYKDGDLRQQFSFDLGVNPFVDEFMQKRTFE